MPDTTYHIQRQQNSASRPSRDCSTNATRLGIKRPVCFHQPPTYSSYTVPARGIKHALRLRGRASQVATRSKTIRRDLPSTPPPPFPHLHPSPPYIPSHNTTTPRHPRNLLLLPGEDDIMAVARLDARGRIEFLEEFGGQGARWYWWEEDKRGMVGIWVGVGGLLWFEVRRAGCANLTSEQGAR